MPLELHNTRTLVTGASSGIGAATAEAFASRGSHLSLMARREDRLAEVADRCIAAGAPDVQIVPADLADLDSLEQILDSTVDHMGGLDVLVNNAGMPMRRSVTALTPAEVERTMAVNYFAPVRLSLRALGGMLERGRGCIVNVSSVGGRFPGKVGTVYDTVGSPLTVEVAMRLLAERGTLVQLGVGAPGRFEWTPWYFKELRLVGSNAFGMETFEGRSAHAYEHFFDLILAGRVDLSGMLSHTWRLERWREAFVGIVEGADSGAIKVGFDFR